MLALFFASLNALEIPNDYAPLIQRHQWVRSSDYTRSPCVAIDAYVRPYTNSLYVIVAGMCDGLRPGNVWCEIKTGKASRKMQKALDVRAGANPDTHGGQVGGIIGGDTEPIQMWYQIGVDCGPIGQKGQVTLLYGNSSISGVTFSFPSTELEPTGAGVCTRLHDLTGWESINTQLLIEWIEWQLTIGFSVVHVYVHSMRSADVWRVLAAYARAGHVTLHAWSESTDDDVVTHLWEIGQVAFIADCFLRLEGAVLYSAALDHSEFLHPSMPSIVDALDSHYSTKKSITNVIMLEPISVIATPCTSAGGLLVAQFCKAHDSPYKRHKYVLRSNSDHPVVLLPGIHTATDGRPVARVDRKLVALLHVSPSSQTGRGKTIAVPWNADFVRRTTESLINRSDDVQTVYGALAVSVAAAESAACFKFIDGGSETGDSLLRLAFPERFPRSGFATAVKAFNVPSYTCRQAFAFDGNPKVAETLRNRCTELVQNNFTCAVYDGILGTQIGASEFYIENKATTNQLGSSIYHRPGYSSVEVVVFDFVAFLRSAVVASDFVVVRLDVEASEYDLLQALIADTGRPKACKLVDALLVEWHASKLTGLSANARKEIELKYGGTLETQQNKLVDALKQCGVDVQTTAGVTD